jgi:hypothetical protein
MAFDFRAYNQKRRAAAKQHGLCGTCWTHPAAQDRTSCPRCLERCRQRYVRCRKEHVCPLCGEEAAPGRVHCAPCMRFRLDENREVKLAVLRAYGDACACCGERVSEFLTIDHVDRDGSGHRKRLFGSKDVAGQSFYRWLKRNDFPLDFEFFAGTAMPAGS